ncbi:hypothetical protein Tco_0315733 [Tanacetum coccineum]
MVACLERTEGNADFHQIVDFLNASTIWYSLTISPTIYVSYIKQFWATAKFKIVNNETQIHAKVDCKTIVMSESSVRSNIHFNDEDGVTSLTNSKILENLALMGYEIVFDKLTFQKAFFSPQWKYLIHGQLLQDLLSWVLAMLVPQVVEGEGSRQPFEPQPPPSTAPPSQEEQVPAVTTSLQQKTQTPRQAKRGRDTKIPQSGGPPEKVGDEVVHKELGDRVEKADTTAASLDAEQDNGGSPRCQEAMGGNTLGSDEERLKQHELTDNVPPTPHDSPLSGGHTPGSDEGRPNINELMAICTNLSNRVLALETSKTAQDLVIKKLKKKVKRLENKLRARTPRMKLFKIDTSKRKSLDKENVSKHGRNLKIRAMFEEGDFDDDIDDMVNEVIENVEGDTVNAAGAVNTTTTGVSVASASVTTAGVSISTVEPRTPPTTTTTAFEDGDLTIAQTLVKMRSKQAKVKGVDFRDVEESARSTTILPTIDPKDKGKGIMQEPEKPPKNPIKAQIQRDAEIAQRLFEEEQAQFEREQRIARERAAEQEAKDVALIEQIEDIQARMDANELLIERLQQEEREQFTIEEKSRMLVEMIAERKRLFAAQRAKQIRNKPPTKAQLRNKMVTYLKCMDDDVEKEELRAYLDIIPGDDKAVNVESLATKYLIIFSKMLDDFDRQDVLDLYRLVKERFETASPEGYDRLLWGDLIIVFEPSEDDDIWKAQQDYTLISWRLFDSCGVHVLLMDTRIAIHMLIEKTYPLTQEMLSRMLSRRLEVDHECEMAYELLRFTRSQLKK